MCLYTLCILDSTYTRSTIIIVSKLSIILGSINSNNCTILSLAPSPPDYVYVYQRGVGCISVYWEYFLTYDNKTEFTIYYQQQDGGERLSMTFESNMLLHSLSWWWYWSQKVTISGLRGGATYSVSVVAVSFRLYSDETTAFNITIGIVTKPYNYWRVGRLSM